MYLKFNKDKITDEQLMAIKEILGCDVNWFYNAHYETCKLEIECAIENNLSIEEILEIRNNPRFDELVEKYTDNLYNKTDHQWDCLYDKAEEIVNDHMNTITSLLGDLK